MTSNSLHRTLLACVAALALAQCGGDPAGPFEGVWSGNSTTHTVGTLTQSHPGMMAVTINVDDTKMAAASLVIEPGRAPGVDIIAHFAGDTCYYNFVRNGNTAMTMTGTSCTQSSTDNASLMLGSLSGMNMSTQNTTISVTNGSLSLSGSTLTLMLTANLTSMNNVNNNPDTQMQNMTQNVMATVTVSFSGTLR